MIKEIPNILKHQQAFVFEYPEFAELADTQLEVFWPWYEIDVAKDKQCLLTEMTESERHGVTTALKLFTTYEIEVADHWSTHIIPIFKRPEISRMASAFGHVEMNSHSMFYDQINKELGLSTVEFYTAYVNDPTLKARMDFISNLMRTEDLPVKLAGFSLIEGAVLYSSFAFLKHFQANGKNKLANICRGINMSVTDENLHSIGGAMLCNTLVSELEYTKEEYEEFKQKVYQLCEIVKEHEFRIVDMLFEKGSMDGITDVQMKRFVESRINTCLQQLKLPRLYNVKYNPIADWFYKGINDFQFNDFFSGIGREYQRNWDSTGFIWNKEI